MTAAIELHSKQVVGAESGPHLLITGGVHGDEFEPMVAVRRLIRELDPAKVRGRVTLIPVVNESAFLRGNRVADDDLDLARVCPGRAAGSITKRIAHVLSALIRSVDFYIDLHTGGTTMSVLPLTGYALHDNRQVLEQQRAMARAFNLPIVWGTSGTLEGRTLSVARDADVPAIYAEYLGAAVCHRAGIEAYVDGCLNVMAELGMIDRKSPSSMIEHVIEDDRPGSGHIQVQNRAPMTGFFEPAIELGDSIAAGEALGSVSDVLGETVTPIVSRQDGIVIVLRTFSRVLEGDSLGVVLEIGG